MVEVIAPEDITFVMVKAHDIGEWFRDHVGRNELGPDKNHYRSESVPRNYLHYHARNWTGETPQMVWSELDLITYTDNTKKLRPDLILEYCNEIWIVEVKSHWCRYDEVFKKLGNESAVEQLYGYRDRIQELGWWKNKEVNLAVLWSVNPSDLEKVKLPASAKICMYWPDQKIPL